MACQQGEEDGKAKYSAKNTHSGIKLKNPHILHNLDGGLAAALINNCSR
jgi:hypothetical protein